MDRRLIFFFKFLFTLFAFFFSEEKLLAQTVPIGTIVAFHPSAGNIITPDEKKEFGIFPEYEDNKFASAQLVRYDSTSYTVLINCRNGQSFEKPITLSELDTIYARIEAVKSAPKINTYADEKKRSAEELRKKEERADTAKMVAEITFEVLFVLLSIWADR